MDCDVSGFKCSPIIKVISSGFTFTSSDCLEIRVELSVNATVYECSNIPLIVDLDTDEACQIKKADRGAMTIYFASVGENI